MQLIDRSRRPATLTAAGQIFATHARDILADVGSARSAIGVLRALDEESLAVLTTPCIGAALFPEVIADLLGRPPQARVALSEHGWQDGERRHPADGFVLAVLPTLSPAAPARAAGAGALAGADPGGGAADHELAAGTGGRRADRALPRLLPVSRWWSAAMSTSAEPEIVAMLGARGLEIGTADDGGHPADTGGDGPGRCRGRRRQCGGV